MRTVNVLLNLAYDVSIERKQHDVAKIVNNTIVLVFNKQETLKFYSVNLQLPNLNSQL